MEVMSWVLSLLIAQGVLGAIDTIYHHEMTVALPRRRSARKELTIHAIRALLYGVVFAAVANVEFYGAWVFSISALVLVELSLALWDFVVADASRKLPATERILQTILAINGGALFGLYAWQLAQWWSLPTALVHVDHGWQGMLVTLLAVGVVLSGVRDGFAAAALAKAAVPLNPFLGQPHRKILVSGGTGFIGEALVSQMLDVGHEVTVLARDPLRAGYLFDGRARCVRDIATLDRSEHFDTVINLAGAPVVGARWNDKRKAQLLASRVNTTQQLVNWFAKAKTHPACWIQASAIGYYGVRPASETLTEDSLRGEGFMAELCASWEAAAVAAETLGARYVCLRFGLVFGPGGALPALLLPYRFGFGGRLGDGQQMMSWIHRDDLLSVVAEAMNNVSLRGIYNAVAPEAVTQAQFAKTVGQVLVRPVWLHLPASLIRWLAGEMAQLFVDGQHVTPKRLLDRGFQFRYPTLLSAIRDLA